MIRLKQFQKPRKKSSTFDADCTMRYRSVSIRDQRKRRKTPVLMHFEVRCDQPVNAYLP